MRRIITLLFFCIAICYKTFGQEVIEINSKKLFCSGHPSIPSPYSSDSVPSKYDDGVSQKGLGLLQYTTRVILVTLIIIQLMLLNILPIVSSCRRYKLAKNQKIYLGHITSNAFSNTNRPDIDKDITDLTLVYDGSVQWNQGRWNKITFKRTTPFNYDNTKNLVVYFVNKHKGGLFARVNLV